MNYNGLAYTGMGSLGAVGAFGQFGLIAIGLGLVIGGAMLVRRTFRQGKSPQEI